MADLRPYTAYETLQNSLAYLQNRHEYGVSCRERNLWLSHMIRTLPSPGELERRASTLPTETPTATEPPSPKPAARSRQPRLQAAPNVAQSHA